MHHLVVIPLVPDTGDEIADDTARELLADALWAAGAVGVEDLGPNVRGAFTDPETARATAARLGGTVEPVADDTGLDAWRDHATSHRAGPFLVRPPWIDAVPETLDLVIDPRHAFGSGSHPSTRLALDLLAGVVGPDDHVLDVGTGSGILAIAAARLGARVVALDTDPNAEAAVRANAEANAVADRVDHRRGDGAAATGDFTLGLCNMTIDLHEAIGPSLAAGASIGRLIVAGILAGEQERRAAAAHGRAKIVDRRVDGDWVALLLA